MNKKLTDDSSAEDMTPTPPAPSFFWSFCFYLSPLEAGDGVYGSGKRHATPQGPVGAEDINDPEQHPAAAGGAATDSGAAAEGPGTGHTGRRRALTARILDATANVSSVSIFCKCRPHLIFKAGCLVCKSVCSPLSLCF